MRKAKSSEEVSKRTTRGSSKIIKTIQGGIIDFAKFQAEPKKKIKNNKNGEKKTKEFNEENNFSKPQEKIQINITKSLSNKSTATSTQSQNKAIKTIKTSTTKKLEASDNPTESKVTKNSSVKSPKRSPLKREHIKIEVDTLSDQSPGPSPSKNKKFVPPNWQQIFENLKEMRKNWDAPVDTMGCHKCTDDNASDKDKRYQKLLALMLSSQTKDQVTHAAMQRLIDHGCSVDKICSTSGEEIGKLIYPVSFWKNKAKYIKNTSEILKNEYDGDIPSTLEKLIKLPGVGPKMAHLCMQIAWNEVSGIGVDTHVHRISNRLGWVKTKLPEQTRVALEAWLPKEHWAEINVLLVGLGQTICKPDKPKCAECLNRDICPSALKF